MNKKKIYINFFTAAHIHCEETSPANPFHVRVKSGYVLIINNEAFTGSADRPGSQEDVRNLEDLFDTFGFKPVKVVKNRTAAQMQELLEETSEKDFARFDCFICVILSHGSKDGVLGIDHGSIPVDSLTSKFCHGACPTLDGKPKVFFIQACRGTQEDINEVESDAIATMMPYPQLPSNADLLICYSSSPGFQSYRQPEYGSWFIATVVRIFKQYAHEEHLMDMMLRVNHEVASFYSNRGQKQMPSEICMLTKKVFFNVPPPWHGVQYWSFLMQL